MPRKKPDKTNPFPCLACGVRLFEEPAPGAPQVCELCWKRCSEPEKIQISLLSQITEFHRCQDILREQEDLGVTQIARLAKAMERMLVEFKKPLQEIGGLLEEIRRAVNNNPPPAPPDPPNPLDRFGLN